MTSNAVIALIFRFFLPNSTDFQTDYITVVEDRPIMSVKYCLPVPVFRFWPDGQTDGILIAGPRLHCMQRGKTEGFYRAACNVDAVQR